MSLFRLTPAHPEPPPAEIPTVNESTQLHAEIFGVDDDSFIYIGFSHGRVLDRYQDMHTEMEEATSGEEPMALHRIKNIGTYCIVEHGGRRGGLFSRGQVLKLLETKDGSKKVSVLLIDDYLEVEVSTSKLYGIKDAILRYPLFSMKSRLFEMDCFLGNPFLKTLYEAYTKGSWTLGMRRCIVEQVMGPGKVNTFRIKTYKGMDLTTALQEKIPAISRLDFPLPNVPEKARIVNCTDSGKVWYQAYGEKELINVVKKRLQFYKNGVLKKNTAAAVVPAESWKSFHFEGEGKLYIAEHPYDKQPYRVRLIKEFWNFTAEVEFIDYGFKATVLRSTMVPMHWIDPTLAFIAPQCLAIKLMGTEDNSVLNPLDKKRFWKYVTLQPVAILMRDYGLQHLSKRLKGLIVPEADILVRSIRTPGKHPGHSLHEILKMILPQSNINTDVEEDEPFFIGAGPVHRPIRRAAWSESGSSIPWSESGSSIPWSESGSSNPWPESGSSNPWPESGSINPWSESGSSSPESGPVQSHTSRTSTGSQDSVDSAFDSPGGSSTEEEENDVWSSQEGDEGSRQLSTLASSYFRQLRLINKK